MAVAPGRRLGFAEFGDPHGRALLWLHGTPGARRQIPVEARRFAVENGFRLVGIDRPGVGSSNPYQYGSLLDFVTDLEVLVDGLGIDRFSVVGLSGGGPYALAVGRALPDRVVSLGVLGGVAPSVGPDAIGGGLVALGQRLRPLVSAGRVPLGIGLGGAVRLARPVASPAIGLYARLSPEGDRQLLGRPEFKAMFLDDLLNGSRKQLSAPVLDLLLFTKDWGFRVGDVNVPVRWWHGDDDRIVPVDHGRHMVSLLPDATLITQPGESHLAGLGAATEVLETMAGLWPSARRRRPQPQMTSGARN